MARYIEMTDELLTSVINACNPNTRIALRVKDVLEKAPTADVAEVKHGEWIKKYPLYKIDGIFVCSNCKHELDIATGEETPIDRGFFYCPHCGAKMDGTPKERGGEK